MSSPPPGRISSAFSPAPTGHLPCECSPQTGLPDRRRLTGVGCSPRFHCRPILFHHEGNVIINFGRTPLTGSAAHPRDPSLPQLSASQLEALDAIEAIAKATQLEIATQAGDIHFINNLTILHRREGFVDGSDATQKRHLVRMLLRDSKQGWAIPKELQREWFEAFEKDADQVWHLEPMPEGFFPLRINTN